MLQRRGRMKKKICPVCDSELLSGNYCRICKKIVWEPRYENRNFNLNESRRSKPAFYDTEGTAAGRQKITARSSLPALFQKESPPRVGSHDNHSRRLLSVCMDIRKNKHDGSGDFRGHIFPGGVAYAGRTVRGRGYRAVSGDRNQRRGGKISRDSLRLVSAFRPYGRNCQKSNGRVSGRL